MWKKEDGNYDTFIRQALAAGFTDDQVDFLWDWIMENNMLKK